MTKEITTSITINASKEKVWKLLMDFEKYPTWNSFIYSISGNPKVGHRIYVKLQGMTFKPVVLTLNEYKEFKWLGHFLFKGLFDGMHKFYITDNGNGSINFEQSELFTGVLVKLFSKKIDKNTKQGFQQMNKELKLLAENG